MILGGGGLGFGFGRSWSPLPMLTAVYRFFRTEVSTGSPFWSRSQACRSSLPSPAGFSKRDLSSWSPSLQLSRGALKASLSGGGFTGGVGVFPFFFFLSAAGCGSDSFSIKELDGPIDVSYLTRTTLPSGFLNTISATSQSGPGDAAITCEGAISSLPLEGALSFLPLEGARPLLPAADEGAGAEASGAM